jgi:hypothetical protein
VDSGVSGARNIEALFLILGWDRYIFDKQRAGTLYVEHVFLHPVGSAGHVVHSGWIRGVKRRCTIFHAHLGPVLFP